MRYAAIATAIFVDKFSPILGKIVNIHIEKNLSRIEKIPSLSNQKIQISEKLRELNRKIIVFIDDIDRLDPDDMLNIFKLVKSVADFPNIIYILGLDRNNTCALLEGKHSGLKGHEYLDKIVQYPIDLPHPGENRLNKLLGNFINATLDQEDDKNFDQYKRYRFYNQYLSKKLNTPRAVMRLSSAFNLHYNRLRGDVDPVDFLAIESIRLLDPAFFPEIQRHSKLFLRTDFDDINNKETPSKIYIDEKLKNNIILRNGLQIIFPNWNKKDSSRLPDSSQKSLICSPNYFARYFSHVIDDHEFTKQQIIDDLAETDDVKKFEEKLDSYKNQIIDENETKLNYFFSKLNDIIDDVDIKIYYKNLCHCFLIIGDNYLDVHKLISSLGGYFTAQTSIICIIEKILKEDRGSVYIILNDSFKESDSIYTCSQTFRFFLAEYGLYNEPKKAFDDQSPQPYLTEKQIEELKIILLVRFKRILENPLEKINGRLCHQFLDHPKFEFLIYRLCNWKLDLIREFLERLDVSSDDGLLALLMAIKSRVISSNGNYYKIHKETLEMLINNGLINIEDMKSLCRRMLDSPKWDPPLSHDEKQVLESCLGAANHISKPQPE